MRPQEQSAADNQAKAKDVLAVGEKALADALGRHSEEMQELHRELDKVQQELRVSRDEGLELKTQIEQLKAFRETAGVRPECWELF